MPIGHGEDLANVAAQAVKDTVDKTAEVTAKATGNIAKMLLEMILNKLKQSKEKEKLGKTNLEEILKSGQEVKMVEMNKADIKDFAKISKEYGIQFAVIGKKSKDVKSIMFKASDVERVQKALESLIEVKVQRDQEQHKKQELKDLKSQHKQEMNQLKEKQKLDRDMVKDKAFDLSQPLTKPAIQEVGKLETNSNIKSSLIPDEVKKLFKEELKEKYSIANVPTHSSSYSKELNGKSVDEKISWLNAVYLRNSYYSDDIKRFKLEVDTAKHALKELYAEKYNLNLGENVDYRKSIDIDKPINNIDIKNVGVTDKERNKIISEADGDVNKIKEEFLKKSEKNLTEYGLPDEVISKAKSDISKVFDNKDRVADIFGFDDKKNPLFNSENKEKSMKIIEPNKRGIEKYGLKAETEGYDDGYYNGTLINFYEKDGSKNGTFHGYVDDRHGTLTDYLIKQGFDKENLKELESDKTIGNYLKKERIEIPITQLVKSELNKAADPVNGNLSYIVDKRDPMNYIEIKKAGKELSATIFENGEKGRSRNLKDYHISSVEHEMSKQAHSFKEPVVVSKEELAKLKDQYSKEQRPSVKVKLNGIKNSRDSVSKAPKDYSKGKVKVAAQGEK